MSITLLTSVPGGGKTSYAVWNVIKKAHEDGRVIYTCGIPKLKIPTIEISYADLKQWYERDDPNKELPNLVNIEHGSVIVIDEVQKLWPAQGTKISQDIKDLSEHRHFGLSFLILTQSPNLIHRNVLALVDRHLHIRPNWSGRKLYEWPEYCKSPSAVSNKNVAVVSTYTLPKQSFKLYHSATEHIKPEKRIPMGFFIFVISLIAVPVMAYQAFDRIYSKADETIVSQDEQETEPQSTPEKLTSTETQPAELTQQVIIPTLPSLLSANYDWQNIAACLSSENIGCICYGDSAQRLVVPIETCELAAKHGWGRKVIRTPPPVLQTDSI